MLQVSYKRNSVDSYTPSFNRDYRLNRILATSALSLPGKRPYGQDYVPFCRAYGARNVGLQVAKAALLQTSMAVLEYNVYLERANASEDEIEDFDFKAAQKKYTAAFLTLAKRNLSISIMKHFYELMAVLSFSSKTADRFSKNLLKSITRKLIRYPRVTACTRIFRTALWTGLTFNCATLTVDIAFNISDYLYNKNKKFSTEEVVVWFGKKVAYYSVCSISSAAGYAIGSYLNPNTFASFSACAFEGIFSNLIIIVLRI